MKWLALAIPLVLCSIASADNFAGFRGDGSCTVTADPPLHWSAENGIVWTVDIPGYGQSQPVVYDGRIFVTSSDGPWQQQQHVHAFDLQTGDHLWTRTIKASLPVENYFRNSRAAPTCVVDSEAVYSFFASGDVTAMTHDGDTLWSTPVIERNGKADNERGVASSLAQADDHLFVLVDHHGPSYLVTLTKADGTTVWKADRGNRVPSWSSPVIASIDGRNVVITSSADTVDAYDAETGDSLWQLDGLKGNHIPSASVVGNRVYVGSTTMYGGASDEDVVAGSNCCIELSERGNTHRLLWGAERANSYYSTPLCFAGFVYYVNKVGVLYCVDAETGKQVFAKRIGNPCWASAIGVTRTDGEQFVYFVTKNGFTVIIRPGEEYDQVARNQLWDAEAMLAAHESAARQRRENTVPADEAPAKSGPEAVFAGMPESRLHQMFSYGDPMVYAAAIADDCLLIRTGQKLFCVGEKRVDAEAESQGDAEKSMPVAHVP